MLLSLAGVRVRQTCVYTGQGSASRRNKLTKSKTTGGCYGIVLLPCVPPHTPARLQRGREHVRGSFELQEKFGNWYFTCMQPTCRGLYARAGAVRSFYIWERILFEASAFRDGSVTPVDGYTNYCVSSRPSCYPASYSCCRSYRATLLRCATRWYTGSRLRLRVLFAQQQLLHNCTRNQLRTHISPQVCRSSNTCLYAHRCASMHRGSTHRYTQHARED